MQVGLRRSRSVLALVCASLLAPVAHAAPASGAAADRKVVTSSGQYLAALAAASVDSTAPHVIALGADIVLGGAPVYSGVGDLTIDGQGFTLDGDATYRSVLLSTKAQARITIEDLTAVNGARPANHTNENSPESEGGAVRSAGPLVVERSTFRNNAVCDDGGAVMGKHDVTIVDSLLDGNYAGNHVRTSFPACTDPGGGAVYVVEPDGMEGTDPRVRIVNSTIVNNYADDDGGALVFFDHDSADAGTPDLELVYTTIAHNTTVDAFSNFKGQVVSPVLTAFGLVIQETPGAADCTLGSIDPASSYSYSTDTSCSLPAGQGNTQNGADTNLGALAHNGGPTDTRLLTAGSALRDVVPADECDAVAVLPTPVTTDQRGMARPQGAACDIGAVERAAGPPTATASIDGPQIDPPWYVGDVDVTWEIEDGFADDGCADTTITHDTAGTVLTCTAANEIGSTTEDVTVRRDTTAPVLSVTKPGARVRLTSTMSVAWGGTDMSGIEHYDVARRVSAWNAGAGTFGVWLDDTADTSTTVTGASAGRTYCFRTRAQDVAGNGSAYSTAKCSTVPLRSNQLAYSPGWTVIRQGSLYAGEARRTTTRSATMTRTGIVAERLYLVATKCPTCGRLAVSWNGNPIANVDLSSSTLKRSRIVPLTSWSSSHRGTLRATVTSSGKPVVIEGLAVFRD
jgi:hypothetical protein